MAETSTDLLEIVLKDVAAAGAEPWYAADYARATGIPRDRLDATLDHLRLAGLVRLTDWVQGRGQGYALTTEGGQVLESPRLLTRLREGRELPRRAEPRPAEAPPTLRESGTPWDRGEAIRQALLNPRRPVITQTLLALNFLWFAYGAWLASRQGITSEYLSFSTGNVQVVMIHHELGTLDFADLVLSHEWWRLLSYCFVHLGLIHLLMNMYVLYAIGSMVEAMWGRLPYLALYLVAGLCGGAAQMLIQPSAGIGGASGSLCGLLTSMAVWVRMNRAYLPPQLVQAWMRNIITNIFLIVFISLLPRVSWAGHLGGAVGGALVSVPLIYARFGRGAQRWLGWAAAAAVPLLAVGLLQYKLPRVPADLRHEAGRLKIDDAGVRQAREKYQLIYQKADSIAENTYSDFAGRILRNPRFDAKVQPAITQQYALRFEQKAKELEELAGKLTGADEFGRAIAAHVAAAHKQVATWAKFYETFAAALTPPENWVPQRRQELDALFRQAQQLRRALRQSPIFRAEAEEPDA